MAIVITVHGDPVPKGRPRFVRATGRTYTPPQTERYEERLKAEAKACMRAREILRGPLSISVEFLLPIPESWSDRKRQRAANGLLLPATKPDFDNLIKCALDACNKIVWRDDAQIVDARIRKRYGLQPSLTVIVREIGTSDMQDAA